MRLINSWDSLQMRTCPDTSQALAETTCSKTRSRSLGCEWLKIVEFPFWESEFYPESVNRKVQKKWLASYKFSYWKQIFHHWYDCWLLSILIILYSVLSSASQHPIAMEFTLVAWEHTHCRAIIQSRLKPTASMIKLLWNCHLVSHRTSWYTHPHDSHIYKFQTPWFWLCHYE